MLSIIQTVYAIGGFLEAGKTTTIIGLTRYHGSGGCRIKMAFCWRGRRMPFSTSRSFWKSITSEVNVRGLMRAVRTALGDRKRQVCRMLNLEEGGLAVEPSRIVPCSNMKSSTMSRAIAALSENSVFGNVPAILWRSTCSLALSWENRSCGHRLRSSRTLLSEVDYSNQAISVGSTVHTALSLSYKSAMEVQWFSEKEACKQEVRSEVQPVSASR